MVAKRKKIHVTPVRKKEMQKERERELKFVLLTIITDIVVAKFHHKTWKNTSTSFFIIIFEKTY